MIYPIQFGSLNAVCERAALIVCPMIGTAEGIEPDCYSRNVQLGAQLIFQPATCFVHIAALIMTLIMILHVRSKYTAVGRKEIVLFFYIYMIIELLAIFLDSGIIPSANGSYPWFAAVYAGFIGAIYWCLLVNGFVGFQFAEDGTPTSLWFIRISSLIIWGVCFFIAIATFKEFAGFKYTKTTGLFITYLIFPAVCVVIYVCSQLILVIRTLDDRWAIGDILFGVVFYAIGVVILLAFSVKICIAVSHYIDGLFIFTMCMLLSVMMVYKYWDSITKEDLEFSVGSKAAVWEVKDPLLPPNPDFIEEDSQSTFQGAGGSLVGGMTGNQYYGNVSAYPRDRSNYAPSSASGHNGGGAGRYVAQAGYTGGYGS